MERILNIANLDLKRKREELGNALLLQNVVNDECIVWGKLYEKEKEKQKKQFEREYIKAYIKLLTDYHSKK